LLSDNQSDKLANDSSHTNPKRPSKLTKYNSTENSNNNNNIISEAKGPSLEANIKVDADNNSIKNSQESPTSSMSSPSSSSNQSRHSISKPKINHHSITPQNANTEASVEESNVNSNEASISTSSNNLSINSPQSAGNPLNNSLTNKNVQQQHRGSLSLNTAIPSAKSALSSGYRYSFLYENFLFKF
jgi:hypothetical protein